MSRSSYRQGIRPPRVETKADLEARLPKAQEGDIFLAALATLNRTLRADITLDDTQARAYIVAAGAIFLKLGHTPAALVSAALNAQQYAEVLYDLLKQERP
jgi:hypothetical protein